MSCPARFHKEPGCCVFEPSLIASPVNGAAMLLGYNTNGMAFHRWQDALELIAEIGFRAVAITVDHQFLNPFSEDFAAELRDVRCCLERLSLRSVIETGARFLLDPRCKHEPTLISTTAEARARRIDFLTRCLDIAKELNSDAVSFWSGVWRGSVQPTGWEWLVAGCRRITDEAERRDVQLAFEPEPGMLIESFHDFEMLAEAVNSPRFGLTIDIGHVQCVEQGAIADHLRHWAGILKNVHIEDMRRGVHEHLRFGEGEIDFPPVMAALREIGYTGCVNVELSRHSHLAPEVLRESFEFLSRL